MPLAVKPLALAHRLEPERAPVDAPEDAELAAGEGIGGEGEEELVEDLARRNAEEVRTSSRSLGSLGAVVGATRTAGGLALTSLGGPFLVPGVGAQGATPEDVGSLFVGCPSGSVLVNASRSILAAGPSRSAVATAARQLADELRGCLG